jgi:hypothetical protein
VEDFYSKRVNNTATEILLFSVKNINLNKMDHTTATEIMQRVAKRVGVPLGVAKPDDPIYSEGPSIQFMNRPGRPTKPSEKKKATGTAVYKPDLPNY